MSDPFGAFLTGLVGDDQGAGFRGGYSFRTGINERRRQATTEQENLTYQRALRLRQDVAAQLDQRVRQGQLDAQGRAAEEYNYNLGRRPVVEQQQQAKSEADLAREGAQTRYYEAQAGRAERTPASGTGRSMTPGQERTVSLQQAQGDIATLVYRIQQHRTPGGGVHGAGSGQATTLDPDAIADTIAASYPGVARADLLRLVMMELQKTEPRSGSGLHFTIPPGGLNSVTMPQ